MPTSIINLSQYIAKYLGRPLIPNAQVRLEDLVQRLETIRPSGTGLDPGEMVAAVSSLMSSYFKDVTYEVEAKLLKGIGSNSGLGLTVVSSLSYQDLKPAPNEIKLISIGFIDDNNVLFDKHAQIVSGYKGDLLHLVDPNLPHFDLQARYVGDFALFGSQTPKFRFNAQITREDGTEVTSLVLGLVITIKLTNGTSRWNQLLRSVLPKG